jgi:hypothetical protein
MRAALAKVARHAITGEGAHVRTAEGAVAPSNQREWDGAVPGFAARSSGSIVAAATPTCCPGKAQRADSRCSRPSEPTIAIMLAKPSC